jgi:ribosomal protein L11 methylase PrmA
MQLLAPRAYLVVTGITPEDEGRVTAAIREARLQTPERRSQDGWLCLTLVSR